MTRVSQKAERPPYGVPYAYPYALYTYRGGASSGGGGPISCVYPLDASSGEITALGLTGKLTMSNVDRTGSYTIQSGLGAQQTYGAAATGIGGGTSAQLDLSSGMKVIEFATTVPAGATAAVGEYSAYMSVLSPAFATKCTVQIVAGVDGLYNLKVLRAGNSVVSNLSSVATCPALVSMIFDCDNGTFSVRYDGVAVPLSNSAFTPGNAVVFMQALETANSAAGNAGKVISMTERTEAADYTGTYLAGSTDPCGNALVDQGTVYAKWSQFDKGPDIALSGGNLVVTNSSGGGSWQCTRATIGKQTGKYKVEINVAGTSSPGQDVIVGIGTAAASTSQFVGQNANSYGLQGNGGGILYHSGGGSALTGADFENGGIITILVDTDAMLLKYRFAGGSYTSDVDISSLAGNDIYFMCAVYASTRTATANFGATAFAYTDSGYVGVSQ